MHPKLYEITFNSGEIVTVRSMSPVCAVARYTGMPRHNWTKNADGSLTVTARHGDGTNYGTYNVRLSCFENFKEFSTY